MRSTVIWNPVAESQLFDLWLNSPDLRTELTDSTHRIDRLLRDDPQVKGRPFGVLRILIELLLVVLYSVDDGGRKVHVLSVRLL